MNKPPYHLRLERIPVNHIDLGDESFSLLPETAIPLPERARASIARVGLLHPPIIRRNVSATHQIVAGRQRLLAAYAGLHGNACPCLVIEQETPDPDCLALALEDILTDRAPSAVELAVFFAKILRFIPVEIAANRFLPIVSRPADPQIVKQLVALLQIEPPILRAVHDGFVPEAVARTMLALSFADRMALFEIVAMLGLNGRDQKRLVAGCRELSSRLNISILSLLGTPTIRQIIDYPGNDRSRQAADLLSCLHRLQFPELDRAETEFRAFTAGMELPDHMAVSHSPAFTQDHVQLSITFGNRNELQDFLPAIKKILTAPAPAIGPADAPADD